MTMKTTKTQTVLTALSSSPNNYEASERRHQFFLDPNVWNDMGRPQQVTVTVEPGDRLNEEAR
jgi:hypothetical protein